MDKEILEILKAIQIDIKELKEGQNGIVNRLDRIEEKLELTYEQVILNSEDIVSVKENLGDIEYTATKNSLDLIKLKNIKNKRG